MWCEKSQWASIRRHYRGSWSRIGISDVEAAIDRTCPWGVGGRGVTRRMRRDHIKQKQQKTNCHTSRGQASCTEGPTYVAAFLPWPVVLSHTGQGARKSPKPSSCCHQRLCILLSANYLVVSDLVKWNWLLSAVCCGAATGNSESPFLSSCLSLVSHSAHCYWQLSRA